MILFKRNTGFAGAQISLAAIPVCWSWQVSFFLTQHIYYFNPKIGPFEIDFVPLLCNISCISYLFVSVFVLPLSTLIWGDVLFHDRSTNCEQCK